MIRQVWQNSKGDIFETEAEARASETYKKRGTWFLDKDANTVLPEDVDESCVWYAQFVDYDDYIEWSKRSPVSSYNYEVREAIKREGIAKLIFNPMGDDFVLLETDKSWCFDEYFERVKKIINKINEP